MQIILKPAGKGKTAEAIKSAYMAAMNHPVLIVCSEEHPALLEHRVNLFSIQNPAIKNRYEIVTCVERATPELFKDLGYFDRFGTIILDVNFAMSHGPWITVCAELEAYGYEVIATQELVKPAQKSHKVYH
ncbi:putative phage protein [Aeromonas phage Aes508]|uniref:Putative phage protein n=1 Tax=Aeromonas phage Aes508 TaxID=1198013 RepID=J7KIA4_9CAUD|nr:hypothetical protein F484_gp079 [Aeromonas phage Aes508]AFQ97162.1 putative phage protein [Aeromonas phage Aes508]